MQATRHAEMEAIDILLEQWQRNGLSNALIAERFSKCTLYVTCEPCIMCAAALSILGMPIRLRYGRVFLVWYILVVLTCDIFLLVNAFFHP